ncbi:MAG TPA: hypothetical protein DCY48_03680 [Candidatus Magasanikbacteria bacterium]|nr:MAG: hypothetical protein A3I74_04595 [Candidatus Magasanikbacteria bacterium RIFCSPLOWO2_02_FULL_47_16]OGH79484.1 MAG: hypothetical protein A3C10_01565 [Candidatus Magasanikbacteria bacterium RIFCSPHIGHO2_02_FULL_48_18]HAZ28845.1 hypothetical protein [Candidatus Magasanikbacteria bacterium]
MCLHWSLQGGYICRGRQSKDLTEVFYEEDPVHIRFSVFLEGLADRRSWSLEIQNAGSPLSECRVALDARYMSDLNDFPEEYGPFGMFERLRSRRTLYTGEIIAILNNTDENRTVWFFDEDGSPYPGENIPGSVAIHCREWQKSWQLAPIE